MYIRKFVLTYVLTWMVEIVVVDSKMLAGGVLIAPDVVAFLVLYCLETLLR